MLLTMAFFVAAASFMAEFTLVHKLPFLWKLYINGALGIDGAIWNLVISIVLSVILGTCFGAQGVVIFVGAGISGLVSDLYFRAERAAIAAGYGPDRLKREIQAKKTTAITWYTSNRDNIQNGYNQAVKLGHDFIRLIIIIIRALTWPIRKYDQAKAFTQTTKARFARS